MKELGFNGSFRRFPLENHGLWFRLKPFFPCFLVLFGALGSSVSIEWGILASQCGTHKPGMQGDIPTWGANKSPYGCGSFPWKAKTTTQIYLIHNAYLNYWNKLFDSQGFAGSVWAGLVVQCVVTTTPGPLQREARRSWLKQFGGLNMFEPGVESHPWFGVG